MRRKGYSKDIILCVDRYTMRELGRYPSVKKAAETLEVNAASIYQALAGRSAIYDCYWIYFKEIGRWKPAERVFQRVNGIKTSEKIEALRNSRT